MSVAVVTMCSSINPDAGFFPDPAQSLKLNSSALLLLILFSLSAIHLFNLQPQFSLLSSSWALQPVRNDILLILSYPPLLSLIHTSSSRAMDLVPAVHLAVRQVQPCNSSHCCPDSCCFTLLCVDFIHRWYQEGNFCLD